MRKKIHLFQIFAILLPIVSVVIGLSQVKTVQEIFIKAGSQPANLIVDSRGVVGPLPRPWRYLAQGGESPDFSLKPMQSELKLIAPEYLRIDHLYDFYIKVSRNGNDLTYDFSKLDKLLQEMKTVGALPFISLSYTPDVLNSDITGAPSNYAEYQKIIKRTIEHISGTKELNIANVYYEVWNEPDLFGQWKTYGEKNYLNLYRSAALGAVQAVNVQPFKFGGPATTKLYDNWIDGLLKMVIAENLRFDFYSWHHYNRNPQEYMVDVQRLKEKMRSYPSLALKTEYVISEWGIDSNNNPAYDSMMGAAHLVSSVAHFPANLSKAFIFEVQDGKSPENKEYWGRWGLYTHADFGSHSKPRAKALLLLNQLGPDKLSLIGEGTQVKAIAARKGNSIQVLLTNYDDANKNTEEVPLTFKRLDPGLYAISKVYLNRTKSSESVVIQDDSYSTTIPMSPNSVVLYEFTKQEQ